MLPTLFYPANAEDVVSGGKVLRIQGSIGNAAKRSVVTIDRGANQGVQSGHVFNVSQTGQFVKDPYTNKTIQLPSERVATIMVFKTFDNVSYAYVLESEFPFGVGAEIHPPIITEE